MKAVFKVAIFTSTFFVGSLALAGSGGGKAYQNLLPQPKANKVMATPPAQVSLVSPAALSKVQGTSVELEWTTVADAQTYHVQVAKDAAFKWIIAEDHFVKSNTFNATNLPKGQIFWRVAASKPQNMAAHWKSLFSSSSFEVE